MNWRLLLAGLIGAGITAGSADAATARRQSFGALADGTAIEAVVLTGANGVSARIITLGATLQSLSAPDRMGRLADVTLGHVSGMARVQATISTQTWQRLLFSPR